LAALDQEKEGISNQNGIETVPVSAELMDALTEVTMDIRKDYLKGALLRKPKPSWMPSEKGRP
jgi:hypothetical protein